MRNSLLSTRFVVHCSAAAKKNHTRVLRHRSQKKQVTVKQVVFKIHERCSNPLYKDTKSCIAYWDAITAFNKEIDHVFHTIRFDGEETFEKIDALCDDDKAHMDECRVYDI